jgi:hypothetical protein
VLVLRLLQSPLDRLPSWVQIIIEVSFLWTRPLLNYLLLISCNPSAGVALLCLPKPEYRGCVNWALIGRAQDILNLGIFLLRFRYFLDLRSSSSPCVSL